MNENVWRGYCLGCDQIVETPLRIRELDGGEIETSLDHCPKCACVSDKILLIDPVTERILERLEKLEQDINK